MKKKIISFIGLALFVGAVALNVKVTNNDSQINELTIENVKALESSSIEPPDNCTYGGRYHCALFPDTDAVWWEHWY